MFYIILIGGVCGCACNSSSVSCTETYQMLHTQKETDVAEAINCIVIFTSG